MDSEDSRERRRRRIESRLASTASGSDGNAEVSLTLAERQERWGFTLDELQTAARVVRVLHENPSLFVGDPYLAESRLYVMLSRSREVKRGEHRDALRQVAQEEKHRRVQEKRQSDREVLKSTRLRQERDAALLALMEPPKEEEEADDGIIVAKESIESEPASRELVIDGLHRCRAAYEVLRCYEQPPQMVKSLHIGELRVRYAALFARLVGHPFGTHMCPALPLMRSESDVETLRWRASFLAAIVRAAGTHCRVTDSWASLPEKTSDKALGIWLNLPLNDLLTQLQNDEGRAYFRAAVGAATAVVSDATENLAGVVRRLFGLAGPPLTVDSLDVTLSETVGALESAGVEFARWVVSMVEAMVIGTVYEGNGSATTACDALRLPPPPSPAAVVDGGEEIEVPYASLFVLNRADFDFDGGWGRRTPLHPPKTLHRAFKCMNCRMASVVPHAYYYSFCHTCGEMMYIRRNISRDLRGKNILITGARIKIGYAMALSLLRSGATVYATTRFPHDAVRRFQAETDHAVWWTRLHLFALDMRNLAMVTEFCAFIKDDARTLFALINNAAQTIARLPAYHAAVRAAEANPPADVARLRSDAARRWDERRDGHARALGGGAAAMITAAPTGSALALPIDRYDTAAERSDARAVNSWVMQLAEVSGREATEVMAINALAPFILTSQLKPMLCHRDPCDAGERRFVINVSAMEGQFYRFKQTTHPHTNMAKAALNMMTRTSAADYAEAGIMMTSVDTGWITDETPLLQRERRSQGDCYCPLDEVDAAARCLDPIYSDSDVRGVFLKDFRVTPW